MKKNLLAISAACAMVAAAAPAQAITNAPVPTANYITFGGLDWAWASPCAAYGSSCGGVTLTYQATQGWRFPTLAEFNARPEAAAFGTACASAWFEASFTHCDFGDPASGYLFDYGYGVTAAGNEPYADSWVVRGDIAAAVPEAATWAMLVIGFGLVGGAARRRAAVAA